MDSNSDKISVTRNKLYEWLKWAKEKADWYDPLIELEDDILKNVDRDTLEIKSRRE